MSNELLVKAQAIQRELDCDFTRAFQLATGRRQQQQQRISWLKDRLRGSDLGRMNRLKAGAVFLKEKMRNGNGNEAAAV